MPHPLSTLGVVHTAVSLITFAAGLYSFARYHRIDPHNRSATVYLWTMLVSVLTSFGLSSTGGFNVGHALGILALLAVGGGLLIPSLRWLGRARPHLAQLGYTFSFFLLMVPGINETLTRLPAGHPLAEGPESPLVRGALLGWVVVFLVGTLVQQVWLARQGGKLQAA